VKPSVVVVGSLNADLVVRVPRLPSAGETVAGSTLTRSQGGKGANQAAAAARLGAHVVMVGSVGDDGPGREAIDDLEGYGVDCSRVRRGSRPTGVAVVLVDAHGENLIAVVPGANADLDPAAVADAVSGVAAPGSVVLACLEVPLESVEAAAFAARGSGCRFVLDPAPARPVSDELLGLCDVLTPNEHELAVLTGSGPEDLLDRGVPAVVVTQGERGASLYRRGRPVFTQPAFRVAGVDSTGAGDAFNATLAWALASGCRLEEAVLLACAGGALATRGLGARASLATSSEVERPARGAGGDAGS
jgi:ribokinase